MKKSPGLSFTKNCNAPAGPVTDVARVHILNVAGPAFPTYSSVKDSSANYFMGGGGSGQTSTPYRKATCEQGICGPSVSIQLVMIQMIQLFSCGFLGFEQLQLFPMISNDSYSFLKKQIGIQRIQRWSTVFLRFAAVSAVSSDLTWFI